MHARGKTTARVKAVARPLKVAQVRTPADEGEAAGLTAAHAKGRVNHLATFSQQETASRLGSKLSSFARTQESSARPAMSPIRYAERTFVGSDFAADH
jgi:hypothetical protein